MNAETNKRLAAIKTHKLSGPMVDALHALCDAGHPPDIRTRKALVQRGLVVWRAPADGRAYAELTPLGRAACDALFGVDRPELPDGYDEAYEETGALSDEPFCGPGHF